MTTYEELIEQLGNPWIDQGRKQEIKEQLASLKHALDDVLAQDLQWLMSHERGRRIANTWMRWSPPLADPGSPTDEGTARPGRKLVRLLLEHCSDGYVLMRREAHEFHNRYASGTGLREDPRG